MSATAERIANRLLGYPDDARLLLVNADDLGMYPAINEATLRAFRAGIVRSTSLMVPCPAAPDAMRRLAETPGLPVGVHLSVVRDIPTYPWGPLAPRERVPSLLDEEGLLYPHAGMHEMAAKADLGDLEREFRAQIEAVLAAGLRPTHVDWHCLYDGGHERVFDLTLRLAREYGLAPRVDSPTGRERVRRLGLPCADHDLLDSFRLPIEDKAAAYAAALRELPPGLSTWAVHPGGGDAASRSVDPDGWRVRATDAAFLSSPEAREIVAREGIVLVDYAPLQAAWREHRG